MTNKHLIDFKYDVVEQRLWQELKPKKPPNGTTTPGLVETGPTEVQDLVPP